MITEIITFWGIVQGVGFRPTLSRIAAKHRMRGQVRNMGAFVQLIVTDEPERIDAFVEAVQAGKPRLADIMSIDREIIDTVFFDDFRIVSSAVAGDEIAAVPPDVAVCDECLAEFGDATDPRYRHPFISCVNCGPRYTIMERLPYDRDTTTMDDFPMCEFCEEEYINPASRRYHAQTVSCHDCGPQAIWKSTLHNGDEGPPGGDSAPYRERSDLGEAHKRDGSFCALQAGQEEQNDESSMSENIFRPEIPATVEASEASGGARGRILPALSGAAADYLSGGDRTEGTPRGGRAPYGERSDGSDVSNAIAAIEGGGVIALKGVGGYYFVCSPYDENAVRKLREIKVREYKPFAVMFASVEQAREYCEISPKEEEMLTSPKRPIVLLERRKEHKGDGSFCAVHSDGQHKRDGSFCAIHSDGIREHKGDSPFDRLAKRAGIRTACSMSPWDIPIAPLSVGGSAPSRRASGPVTPEEVIRGCAAQGGEYPPPRPSARFTRFHGRNDFGAEHGQNEVVHLSRDGNRPLLSAVPFVPDVSSTSRFIGAFLPSMALQYMLVEALGPLIMTSANISDLPIIKDDDEMFAAVNQDDRDEEHEHVEHKKNRPLCVTTPLVSGVLYNERRIVRRLDDSVIRVIDGTAQLIRRSKGWTPVPIYVRGTDRLSGDDQIFAAGADLKSAFALTKGSFVYMSQYIGDMDNVETERVYADNIASMSEFFKIKPRLVACDMHPLYRTVEFAKEYVRDTELLPEQQHAHGAKLPPERHHHVHDAKLPPEQHHHVHDAKLTPVQHHHARGAELLPVQHHHAHVASVMAEHGLEGPVIGVAFDGTGYGVDGTIWGGEILICEGADFERFSHLRDIPMIGGDASMRDGWKSAVCRAADYDRNNNFGQCSNTYREYKKNRPLCVWEKDDRMEKGKQFEFGHCVPPADERSEQSTAINHSGPPSSICHSGQLRNGTMERDKESIFDIDISYAVEYAKENDTLSEYEAERKTVEAAVAQGVNTVRTSSMGRLFDAVASLLGICHVNRYEGECAIMLENAADRALHSLGVANAIDSENVINAEVAIDAVEAMGTANTAAASVGEATIEFSEGKTGIGGVKFANTTDALALRFHLDVARAILGECRKARGELGTNVVCLSGGVFQNKILMERTLHLLRSDGFTPYYNIAVPQNDGGIALGQAYIAMWSL
jgi:hydrogenase maturation factor HypF (carbamoyltransferase family)